MNTHQLPELPAPFPLQARDAGAALAAFCRNYVAVDRGAALMTTTEQAKTAYDVVVRYAIFGLQDEVNGHLFGKNEELEILFQQYAGTYRLVGPQPIIQYLVLLFRQIWLSVKVKPENGYALITTDKHKLIALRVTPDLITFGGKIVWQRPVTQPAD